MQLKLLPLCLLLFYSMSYAQDLEVPTGPGDYRSGHFVMDASLLTLGVWQQWFIPGDDYCRTLVGRNCDGTTPTSLQISTAQTDWSSLTQCQRFRVRLYKESQIKRIHSVLGVRLQWIYFTGIPSSKVSAIQACNSATFQFIGQTFSTACNTLNVMISGLCALYWPTSSMTERIIGFESDGN